MPYNSLNGSTDLQCIDLRCLRDSPLQQPVLASQVYERLCRTDFSMPGFCVLNLGRSIGSIALRQFMVELKQAMAKIHEQKTGKTLIYHSAMRFDQQESTRPHLDGGPAESLLMLGYEPTAVVAELEVLDYARCAFDLGLSPNEFMAHHNPMFAAGYEQLRPYSTRLTCFSPSDYQIVCINNSSTPFALDQSNWQGTLHTATIPRPDTSQQRVINSTMIASAPLGAVETITVKQQYEFIHNAPVLPKGYE